MKKIIAIVLAIVAVISVVAAYGMGWHNEDIESIVEKGTYQDLVDYRESTGYKVMPFVNDEASFELMQEHHEQMEQYHEEYGYGRMGGRMGYNRAYRNANSWGYGCPMMS